MNIHKRIELAVANAPLETMYAGSANNYSDIADSIAHEADDYECRLNTAALADVPNQVSICVDDTLGLRGLLLAYKEVTGADFDPDYIDSATRHENQHWAAAKMLGTTSGFFGVYIFKNAGPSSTAITFNCRPYFSVENLRTTKLGSALIAAHPLELSTRDNEYIKAHGYSGPNELGRIARQRNLARKSSKDQFYPIPLSWSGLGGYTLSRYPFMLNPSQRAN